MPRSKKRPTLGQTLRKRRTDLNMTIQQVANNAQVGVSTISEIETDQRMPNSGTLLRLAAALNLTLNDLTGA